MTSQDVKLSAMEADYMEVLLRKMNSFLLKKSESKPEYSDLYSRLCQELRYRINILTTGRVSSSRGPHDLEERDKASAILEELVTNMTGSRNILKAYIEKISDVINNLSVETFEKDLKRLQALNATGTLENRAVTSGTIIGVVTEKNQSAKIFALLCKGLVEEEFEKNPKKRSEFVLTLYESIKTLTPAFLNQMMLQLEKPDVDLVTNQWCSSNFRLAIYMSELYTLGLLPDEVILYYLELVFKVCDKPDETIRQQELTILLGLTTLKCCCSRLSKPVMQKWIARLKDVVPKLGDKSRLEYEILMKKTEVKTE